MTLRPSFFILVLLSATALGWAGGPPEEDFDRYGVESRVGWGMRGPSLEGDVLDNVKLLFEGGAEDRILLDDFEILR